MPIVYHSDCCPEASREMALLILEAYRAYQDARNNLPLIETISLESMENREYRVVGYLKAKVLDAFTQLKLPSFRIKARL